MYYYNKQSLMIQKMLSKIQNKIHQAKNPRQRRNFQRLLCRKSLLQFWIIYEIIPYKLTSFDFKTLNGDTQLLFDQIRNTLWFFALEPYLYSFKNIMVESYPMFLDQALAPIPLHTTHHNRATKAHHKSNFKYIILVQFSPNLSQISKYWILSNLILEKKFFFNWIKIQNFTPLKKLFQRLIVLHWKTNLSRLLPAHIFESNNNFLQPISTKVNLKYFKTSLSEKGIRTNFIKIYSVDYLYANHIHFSNWFFQTTPSVDSLKKEIKKYFQTTLYQSVDIIIYNLKKKFMACQHVDHSRDPGLPGFGESFSSYLLIQDFLLWQIWRWLKKRHKNKSFQWLYLRYWKHSTSQKWIFSAHTEKLFIPKNSFQTKHLLLRQQIK